MKRFKILRFSSLPSTQEFAGKLLEKGEQSWTVVWAEEQWAGHGRGGRKFFSPRGGLYFSLLLFEGSLDSSSLLYLSSWVVAKELEKISGVKPEIKWPNDILLEGKKLAGILLEKKKENWFILGVGINLNSTVKDFPSYLQDKIITLHEYTGKIFDLESVLFSLIEELWKGLKLLKEEGFLYILHKWRTYSIPIGKRIIFHWKGGTQEGYYWGVGEGGEVYLRTLEGRVISFTSGDLNLIF